MPYLIDDAGDKQKAFKTLLIEPKIFSVFNSELALKITNELAKKPSCAMDIARKLKQHEQKIYYHIRRLEKAGIINLIGTEERVGALAKLYSVSSPFVSVKLFDGEHLVDVKTKVKELDFFNSFIENGKLNATIVVGSPDTHGKYGAQASDGSAAIDFALFLGTFLNDVKPNYKLDTQIRENELNGNLIVIGGPKANILIDKINDKLPIYFDTKHDFSIVSSLSKSVYPEDDVGIIVKMKNPFNKSKELLVLSGKRFKGTRAAIIGLIKYIRKIEGGNKFSNGIARVVKAIDRDSDGIVDDVEFLE
ncbi:MAG: S-layer protein [Candidatus Aenigmarchaeota archaeon]|nr:S-layer protein [Candidatus Aenigmarchaeota archaeon]